MSGLIRKWISGEGWQTVEDDGGGGGSFNGGTITEALVIEPVDTGLINAALDLLPPVSIDAIRMVIPGDDVSGVGLRAGSDEGNASLVWSPGSGLLLDSGIGATQLLRLRDEDATVVVVVGPTGAVTISPSDAAVVALTANAFTDQTANLIEARDENDALVFRVGPSGNILIQDSTGDQGISLSHIAGLRAFSAAGNSVSFSLDGGVSVSPFDPGSDALNLNGTELDPAQGAAMIILVNPIDDMPDNFYVDNNTLTINADLTHGAAKLLLKAKDSTGTIVTAEIPLT